MSHFKNVPVGTLPSKTIGKNPIAKLAVTGLGIPFPSAVLRTRDRRSLTETRSLTAEALCLTPEGEAITFVI
jgi:hypothetical protein